MNLVWTCNCCGKQYGTLSFAYALDQPDAWHAVPEAEREQRAVLTSDRCVIDRKEFYLRGRLVIPVRDSKNPFIWGTWVNLSKSSFARVAELWNTELREHEPPFFGWLANDIPLYPATRKLKCSLRLRNAGKRPSIELEPSDHPLSAEQRNGITIERVKEIAGVVERHSR